VDPWGRLFVTPGQPELGPVAAGHTATRSPQASFDARRTAIQDFQWFSDNGAAERTTPRTAFDSTVSVGVLATPVLNTDQRFVGIVNVSVSYLSEADKAQSRFAAGGSARMVCNDTNVGSNIREAGCESVRLISAQRQLVFDNTRMTMTRPSAGGNVTSTAIINGVAKWADYAAKTGTTMTKANLRGCSADTQELNPAWSNLQCAAGTMLGTSENGTTCRVTIDPTAGRITYEADGFVGSMGNFYARSGAGFSVIQRDYTFRELPNGDGNVASMRLNWAAANQAGAPYSPRSTDTLEAVVFFSRGGGSPSVSNPGKQMSCRVVFD
jgi:hypothetical protein